MMKHYLWLNFGKLTKRSNQAYSILLLPCTVTLPAISSWSAFLDHICQPYTVNGKHKIGGMGLKLILILVRHIRYLLCFSGLIVDDSWTHGYSKESIHWCFFHRPFHLPTHDVSLKFVHTWKEISQHDWNATS